MKRMTDSEIGGSNLTPPESAVIAKALPYYLEANRHILERSTGAYHGLTADDILEANGIRFRDDPIRWCRVVRELHRISGITLDHRKYLKREVEANLP